MKLNPEITPGKRTVLCIGAHPDDSEFRCCGTMAKFSLVGDKIYLMSTTDGSSGHFELTRAEVRARRSIEAERSAAIIRGKSVCLGAPDGELEAGLEYRNLLIGAIRQIQPDIIITNRPNDYHPDHRYTAQLVQDASYLLMVPNVVPEVPVLRYMPVILYWGDAFEKPIPFKPDMVIDIDDQFSTKITMLMQHESQLFEWLPWINGKQEMVPPKDNVAAREAWVMKLYKTLAIPTDAHRYRAKLIARYGEEKGSKIIECETFEVCEYGKLLTKEQLEMVFQGC